jgi:hypothetical protein
MMHRKDDHPFKHIPKFAVFDGAVRRAGCMSLVILANATIMAIPAPD